MAFASADGGGYAAPKPQVSSTGQTYTTGVYQGGSTPTPNTQFDPGSLPSYINLPGAGSGFVSGMSEGTAKPAAAGSIFGPLTGPYGGPAMAEANRPYDPTAAAQAAGVLGSPSVSANAPGAQAQYQLPDFNTLLQQQLEKLGFGQLDNGLRQQQQQLMIRFGDPSLAALAGFGLDPQSADFARQNYLSGNADLARLDTANKQAKQQIINQLASRGILFSGDTGYLTGRQEQNYGNQRYDLTNKYLDALNQLQQSTQQQKNQIRQNLVNSLLNFYSQFAANPQQLAGVFG